MTYDDLAERVGLSTGQIGHYLARRRNPPIDKLNKIAKALNVTPEFLQFGIISARTEEKTDLPEKERFHLIPIISWDETGEWCFMHQYNDGHMEQKIPVPSHISKSAIALFINGDAMVNPNSSGKSFTEGSIIVVEPKDKASHKEYVLAMLPGSNEATFKQYVIDAGIAYLKPLNPQYPTIKFPKDGIICGVVVANLQFFNKT